MLPPGRNIKDIRAAGAIVTDPPGRKTPTEILHFAGGVRLGAEHNPDDAAGPGLGDIVERGDTRARLTRQGHRRCGQNKRLGTLARSTPDRQPERSAPYVQAYTSLAVRVDHVLNASRPIEVEVQKRDTVAFWHDEFGRPSTPRCCCTLIAIQPLTTSGDIDGASARSLERGPDRAVRIVHRQRATTSRRCG